MPLIRFMIVAGYNESPLPPMPSGIFGKILLFLLYAPARGHCLVEPELTEMP